MAQFDITNPISAYSTHFFPPDAGVPVFIMVYKTGVATAEHDVAGYLMFTDHSMTGEYRDWISSEHQFIVKHFRVAQFASVQALLQHRLDLQKLGMSIHYVGEEIVGGWTTLDAGTSPGLDPDLAPLVMPSAAKAKKPPRPPAPAPAVKEKKTNRRRAGA
jgi:hypothetical protein